MEQWEPKMAQLVLSSIMTSAVWLASTMLSYAVILCDMVSCYYISTYLSIRVDSAWNCSLKWTCLQGHWRALLGSCLVLLDRSDCNLLRSAHFHDCLVFIPPPGGQATRVQILSLHDCPVFFSPVVKLWACLDLVISKCLLSMKHRYGDTDTAIRDTAISRNSNMRYGKYI